MHGLIFTMTADGNTIWNQSHAASIYWSMFLSPHLQPLLAVLHPVSSVKAQHPMALLRHLPVAVQISRRSRVQEEQQQVPHRHQLVLKQVALHQQLPLHLLPGSHPWTADHCHQGKNNPYKNRGSCNFWCWAVQIKSSYIPSTKSHLFLSNLYEFLQVGAKGGPKWTSVFCWSHWEKDNLGEAWVTANRVPTHFL